MITAAAKRAFPVGCSDGEILHDLTRWVETVVAHYAITKSDKPRHQEMTVEIKTANGRYIVVTIQEEGD
jgi:hypothetical protein